MVSLIFPTPPMLVYQEFTSTELTRPQVSTIFGSCLHVYRGIVLLIIAPVDCGALSPPLNGQIFIGNTTTGNVATYLCDSGFLLVDGDDFRVCGADGLWSGDEPTCEGNILPIL